MADLSEFYDVPFKNENAFAGFLMANDLSHQAIASALEQQNLFVLRYPLAETFGDSHNWLQLHNDVHQAELNLLAGSANENTAPYQIDLASVDLSNEETYNSWMQGHGDIHAYVNSLLGL